jgi:hypothetical protein
MTGSWDAPEVQGAPSPRSGHVDRRSPTSARSFGHFGAGGSLGFGDPDAHVVLAYAMNQGRGGWQHKHVRHLIDLVYEAL